MKVVGSAFALLIYGLSAFHILDSLCTTFPAKKELNQLQTILLKHFQGKAFVDGRLTVNIPEVTHVLFSILQSISLNKLGALTVQHRGLCLFHHLFRQEILSKS
jgi:hypothetical protein